MRLILTLFVFSFALSAEVATAVYAPLGIPCDPAGPSPLGPGFPFICPPEEEQGIMVFLRTESADAAGYRTTVRYTTAAGEQREAIQVIAKRPTGIWTADVFKIGRVQTGNLGGVRIDAVASETVASIDAPASTVSQNRNTKVTKAAE